MVISVTGNLTVAVRITEKLPKSDARASVILTNCLHGSGHVRLVCVIVELRWFTATSHAYSFGE